MPSTCGATVLAIVVVFGGGQDQPHADALGDLDRLQHALAFGEAAEEQQVVVGRVAEGEAVGVDAVQHRADDVEAAAAGCACSFEMATNGASG